ncbi:hypothetical protein VTK73DRAFT_3447 [Phialemonium thermophilum]|uniref:Uncharacterized protein n=1 Tax=Phialemonium thermophilum TaxID=223376 RepID=A0ABR3WZG5_9PEZI
MVRNLRNMTTQHPHHPHCASTSFSTDSRSRCPGGLIAESRQMILVNVSGTCQSRPDGYKPVGGPESRTSESTGIIKNVLTKPGM